MKFLKGLLKRMTNSIKPTSTLDSNPKMKARSTTYCRKKKDRGTERVAAIGAVHASRACP